MLPTVDMPEKPIPPTIYAEISLCFDCDFPMDSLNDIIGLKATETKRKSETKINSITHNPNPGYWLYRTEEFTSFNCDLILDTLNALLSAHAEGLSQAVQQHKPSDLFVFIYVLVQQEGEYPAIRLNPQILSTLSSLNAIVDIIVEDEYLTAEDMSALEEIIIKRADSAKS